MITHALNIRTCAGANHPSVLVLPKGGVADVIGSDGKWNNIVYNGQTGWASSDYMTEVMESIRP